MQKRRSWSVQNYSPYLPFSDDSPMSPKKRKGHKNQFIHIPKDNQSVAYEQQMAEYEQYLENNQLIKEGWIIGQFIQLTRSSIREYQDDKKTQLLRVINLKEFNFKVTQDKQFIKIKFIDYNNHLIQYQARDQVDAKIWVGCIKMLEDRYRINLKQKLQPSQFPLYLGLELITEDQFLQIVQTGDLLLFETNNTGAKIQRFITSSVYDHVGIAIKVSNKYLYVFDANADSGVTFMAWNQFIEINDLYERVALRKLITNRRHDVEKKLIEFLQAVHGKRYEVSISKLVRKKSLSPSRQNDSYFCSELVAKAFKQCGLLDSQKASSSFWPVEFTKNLQLSEENYLMDTITVILKKHLQQ